jgi:hypothetical protein
MCAMSRTARKCPALLDELLHDSLCPEVLAVTCKDESMNKYKSISMELLALEGLGADMGMGWANTLNSG